ncbi:MAG: hypothetical protein HYW90_03825 [Candidatus Sungbacteria bacterium]|nr:hypothetical protein [Candidatus Sungbacteria bacterium]
MSRAFRARANDFVEEHPNVTLFLCFLFGVPALFVIMAIIAVIWSLIFFHWLGF